MTDENFSDGDLVDGDLVDGHLTDEQLSSRLDGASDTDRRESEGERAGQHLAVCARCRDRLATFDAGRLLVRTPIPPVAPEARAASIASVLRTAERAQVGGRAHGDAGDAPTPIRAPRRPGVLVGSAAAVLVLAVAVGIPLALSRGTPSGSAASSSATTASATGAAPAGQQHEQQESGAHRVSANANAGAADLGAVDSVAALRSRVTALISADRAASSSTAVPGPAGAVATTTGAPPTSAPASTATTASTAASKAGAGTASQGIFNAEAGPATIRQFELCRSTAVHVAGSKRSVQILATAEFKGTQALVYVFRPVSGGSTTGNAAHSLAVATARVGCRVLGTTAL